MNKNSGKMAQQNNQFMTPITNGNFRKSEST